MLSIIVHAYSSDKVSHEFIVDQPKDLDWGKELPVTRSADKGTADDLCIFDNVGSDLDVVNLGENQDCSQQATQVLHKCNLCNYASPRRYLLTRHEKSHNKERPHMCAVCDKGFKTLVSLENHVNTHTGTKPHRCKFCDANFTTSGELVKHVRYRHTREKPHK